MHRNPSGQLKCEVLGNIDISLEIGRFGGRFNPADIPRSEAHIEATKMQAEMFRVVGLETHHGTHNFSLDFSSVDL